MKAASYSENGLLEEKKCAYLHS